MALSHAFDEEDHIMQSKYALVSGAIFGAVAVIQAIRAFNQWPVQVGPFSVPVWFSWLALVVAGSLCVWAFRAGRQ
ncbi:MAG: hypothetical protein WAM90_01495 [Rhodanobacter sp.]